MSALSIIGAGGHGRVLADIAQAMGYGAISFLDAAYPEFSRSGIWDVTGVPQDLGAGDYALAVGNNTTRLALLESVDRDPVTLIHPSAVVSPHAQIGAGTVICAGAVIGPFARLGRACIVNTRASVDHDCILGDGVHVSPGAQLGGGVQLGARSWIGIGASVREYLVLGSDIMVGAGAAVTRPIPDHTRVGGVPAKEF